MDKFYRPHVDTLHPKTTISILAVVFFPVPVLEKNPLTEVVQFCYKPDDLPVIQPLQSTDQCSDKTRL